MYYYRIPVTLYGKSREQKAAVCWSRRPQRKTWVTFEAPSRNEALKRFQALVRPFDDRPIRGASQIQEFSSTLPYCIACTRPFLPENGQLACRWCRNINDECPEMPRLRRGRPKNSGTPGVVETPRDEAADLAAAMAWWHSDECARLPSEAHARNRVAARWGNEILGRMLDIFANRTYAKLQKETS